MSSAASRAGAFCGALVGVCSALLTATAHAEAGGMLPEGPTAVMLAAVCATVGAVTGAAIGKRSRTTGVFLLALGLMAGQATGHLLLSVIDHHGSASALPSLPMLIAHVLAALALAALIGTGSHAYLVCTSALAWLTVTFVHRGRPRAATQFASVGGLRARMLRSAMRMRAPPRLLAP